MRTISVVVNSYNYGRFVLEAVESALAQSVPPDEIVVVDDGSTDGTEEILAERYANHPTVKIVRQRNGGQLAAVVSGIEAASGDFLFFLDADDKYEPNHIGNVLAAFEAHKDVDFVVTAYRMFGDADEVAGYAPVDFDIGFSVIGALYGFIYYGPITASIGIRRNLALTLLPVLRRAAPRWRIRADDSLNYGAAIAGAKKYFLAEPTVLYRVHGKNNFLNRVESPSDRYAYGFRRDTLVRLFADEMGIGQFIERLGTGVSARFRILSEFRSIQTPTRRHYQGYLGILRDMDVSIRDKARIWLHMRRHYLRHRPAWDK